MKKSIIVSAVLIAATIATANAGSPFEEYSRKGKGEVYGFGEYLINGNTTTFSGVPLKFDPGFGGGIGLAYNVNDYLNVNTDFAFAGSDNKLLGVKAGSTTIWGWNASLDYNILKKRLTPFITGGIGLMGFSGDFGVSGSEFRETDFSYGGGAGVRWDITDHWSLKAVYRANWTNIKDSDNATMFHTITVGIGYSF